MKLITLFIIAACLQVSAGVFAQQITLSKKNAPLSEVFKSIQRQSGYQFFYKGDLLEGANVTVEVRNGTLTQAMDAALKDLPLSYTVSEKIIVIKPLVKPAVRPIVAPVSVSGRVTDTTGTALPGATITNVTRSTAIVSRADGTFNMTAEAGDKITVSFVAYVPFSFVVENNMPFQNIVLHSSGNKLEEVIVTTGIQTSVKERAPGTISHVGQDILANRPTSDLSSALQGVVAGMQAKENADGTVTFTIRGVSTLTNNANQSLNQRAPLIVVDGFPLPSNDFSAINPNDVESVDVLKDAAAAAIWGARSANGVIVVTTKRGKGKKGLSIEGSAFVRVARRPDLKQIYTVPNSADMIAYEKYAFDKKIYATTGYFYQGGIFPSEFTTSLTYAQQLLFGNMYGRVSTADMNRGLDSLSKIDNSSQIQKYLLQRAVMQQYNVSLSDNTDRSKTYMSLLFEKNRDSFIGNGYQRYDINFANEYKLTKFLTVNFNTFLQYNDQSNSGATQAEINGYPNLFGGGLSPYELLVNPDGSYVKQVAGGNTGQSGPDPYILSTMPLSKFPYPDWSYNLLREVRGRDITSKRYHGRIQAGFNIKILPGLTFDGKVQYERTKINNASYYSDDTYYVRNMINTYTAYNNTTKAVGVTLIPKGGINQPSTNDITNYNYRAQLSYIRGIGRKFDINATLGGEVAQYRTDGVTNPWQYGYNPATLTSVVPPYGYGSSVDVFTAATVTGGSINNIAGGNTTLTYGLDRYVSYFGASNITYDKKYTLTLNIRGDASNYITNIPSLRWSPFWSIGGNWDVKAEQFMQATNWVDYLHLRASYGSNGTADKSTSTQALLNVSTAPSVATGTIVSTISSFGNPYLHWERTYIINTGLDFALFKNKLTGSINLYNKKSTEVTGTVSLPLAYGTGSQKFNNAEILNRGIEIELGTSLRGPSGFGFSTSLNYAYNYNKVTRLYFPNPLNINATLYGQQLGAGINTFIEGKPVNAYYTYNYAGVNATTGLPQVYGPNGAVYTFGSTTLLSNNDGVSKGYMNYAGTTIPPHTLGWRNVFTYHNLSLSAQLVGTFGSTFLDPSFNYAASYVGSGKTAPNFLAAQVMDGTLPPILADPLLTVWNRYSPYLTTYVESASYIRLKEMMLSYNIPNAFFSKSQIRNINIYVQARDLGIIWANNKHNYDPDFLPGMPRPLTTLTFGAKFGL